MQLVVVENVCSSGVITSYEVTRLVETLELYAKDINHSPWVEHGYIEPIEVKLLPKGNPFPKGAYNLILQDSISIEGALGYHEDEDGGKIPVSYIPAKEIREDGASVSEVATHELSEEVINPFVVEESTLRTVTHNGKEYIVEVADPVQNCPYRVKNGDLVANFVWPKWFGMAQTRTDLAQSNENNQYISFPFQLAPNGYISIKNPRQEWSQIYGSTRETLPKWASRLPRIGTL
jgi:hypothetical protein